MDNTATDSMLTLVWVAAKAVYMLSMTFGLVAAAAQTTTIALVESMCGPFANTGEAVCRNVQWSVEQINGPGGVMLANGPTFLSLKRYDSMDLK
ncbi:MAG: hypothetical protein Q8Q73_05095 [Stagnimonas sp.]|jgi:branched-chain amino acid transport system substrate-binding protein|nr:hypothetical protein [Stagnimonas sp.]